MVKNKNDSSNDFVGVLFYLIVVIAVFLILTFAQHGVKYYDTVFTRMIFEESYQRQTGLREEISTYEAQLAELEVQLENELLSRGEISNIEIQIASINIRLNSALSQLED